MWRVDRPDPDNRIRAELKRLHSFKPTPEHINLLPDPIRDYICAIETTGDPAYLISQNTLTMDQNHLLQLLVEELKREIVLKDKEIELLKKTNKS